ncbi:MAG: glycosyltransferase [Candidatus Binataceae bacterium]
MKVERATDNPALMTSIKLVTPQQNYGAGGGSRSLSGLLAIARGRTEPLDLDASELWNRVAEEASAAKAKRVLLLGFIPEAGASALADRLAGELQTIDLFSDLGQPHDCRNRRLAADFAFPAELDLAYEELRSLPGPVLIVAVNLLEHLADPRPALAFMRQVLLLNEGNLLLLASPDRALGEAANPPAEEIWLRSWTQDELAALLRMSGFDLGSDALPSPAHVRIEMGGRMRSDTLLLARCTIGSYDAFLQAQGLPYAYDPASRIHLVVTDEHAKIPPVSGGIGSYVEDLEALSDNVFVAFCRAWAYRPEDFAQGYRCLHPKLFWDDGWVEQFDWRDIPELSFLLIQQVLFYYPIIQSIEYQECNGLGARIAAAKRAGMLPEGILLIARCHGSQISFEVGFERWVPTTSYESRLMILEKLSVEMADIISIPSRYLHRLYLECGLDIDPQRLRIEPYSPSLQMELADVPYRPIDTLVFFGRRQLHKGYAEFLDALELMNLANGPIRKVVIFGARGEHIVDEESRIARLREAVQVEEYALPRGEVHARLRSLAPSALFLLPYRADNAPLSIYEVMSAGCQFLAADRGGIPELIPEAFHRDVLVSIEPRDLAARIQEAFRFGGERRKALAASLQVATKVMLAANKSTSLAMVKACYREGTSVAPRRLSPSSDMFTAAVPLLNPSLQDLRDLCDGLNAQTLRPQEVIFVHDDSDPGLRRQAEALVADKLGMPYRFIEHGANRGLAAARNSALASTRTKYFLPVDVDHISLSDHFRQLVYAMEYDGEVWAATSFVQLFQDTVDWRSMTAVLSENYGKGVCDRPIGAGLVYSLIENDLGDAQGCYRVEPIRRIGGWDENGKAKWEDWAMYLNILSHGGRMLVVPSADHLYRTRGKSSARTFPSFPAERLKARALDLLPRFERYRLIALAKEFEDLRAETAHPVFFNGEVSNGHGLYHLQLANGNFFGYYSVANYPFLYHFGLGWEYIYEANDGTGGVYFYDFGLKAFLYTSPNIFPFLYNFSSESWVYYSSDTSRWFYDFGAGEWLFSAPG